MLFKNRCLHLSLCMIILIAPALAQTVNDTPTVRSSTGGALVSVRDNGIGFDTDMPRLQRHGLLGMRYRVEAEGGTMRLSSKPGEGTLIEATLPAQSASNDEHDGVAPVPVAAAA